MEPQQGERSVFYAHLCKAGESTYPELTIIMYFQVISKPPHLPSCFIFQVLVQVTS